MSPLKQKAVLMEFEPLNAADIRDDEACSDQSFCSRDTYERPLAVDDGRDVLAASAYSLHHSPTVPRRKPFKRRNRWTLSAAAGIAVIGAAAVIVSKYHGSRPVHLTGNDKSERPQVQYSNHFGVSPSGLQDTHKGLNLEGDAVLGSYIENAYLPAEVPPLSDLVKDEKIVGDISGLVDFAIIGNPKCGTTFLMHWLARNEDTFVHNGEVCALSQDKPQEIVSTYYDQVIKSGRMATTTEGHRIKGGLKCPKEISTEKGLDNWSKYFPETKFIVTTRHPVKWFQSFYNYHAYGQWPRRVAHPNELIGACYEGSEYLCTSKCGHSRPGNTKICTDRANFHHSLSRLGKTPMDTPEEIAMLDHNMSLVPHKGKLFLMEISQLFPDSPSSKTLKDDISEFLDLKYELNDLRQRHGTGTQNHEYISEDRKQAFVDICDDEFAPVREVLVGNGKEAAEWITEFLMKSPDVVVSQPEEFIKLLAKWGQDPCNEDADFPHRQRDRSLM